MIQMYLASCLFDTATLKYILFSFVFSCCFIILVFTLCQVSVHGLNCSNMLNCCVCSLFTISLFVGTFREWRVDAVRFWPNFSTLLLHDSTCTDLIEGKTNLVAIGETADRQLVLFDDLWRGFRISKFINHHALLSPSSSSSPLPTPSSQPPTLQNPLTLSDEYELSVRELFPGWPKIEWLRSEQIVFAFLHSTPGGDGRKTTLLVQTTERRYRLSSKISNRSESSFDSSSPMSTPILSKYDDRLLYVDSKRSPRTAPIMLSFVEKRNKDDGGKIKLNLVAIRNEKSQFCLISRRRKSIENILDDVDDNTINALRCISSNSNVICGAVLWSDTDSALSIVAFENRTVGIFDYDQASDTFTWHQTFQHKQLFVCRNPKRNWLLFLSIVSLVSVIVFLLALIFAIVCCSVGMIRYHYSDSFDRFNSSNIDDDNKSSNRLSLVGRKRSKTFPLTVTIISGDNSVSSSSSSSSAKTTGSLKNS